MASRACGVMLRGACAALLAHANGPWVCIHPLSPFHDPYGGDVAVCFAASAGGRVRHSMRPFIMLALDYAVPMAIMMNNVRYIIYHTTC